MNGAEGLTAVRWAVERLRADEAVSAAAGGGVHARVVSGAAQAAAAVVVAEYGPAEPTRALPGVTVLVDQPLLVKVVGAPGQTSGQLLDLLVATHASLEGADGSYDGLSVAACERSSTMPAVLTAEGGTSYLQLGNVYTVTLTR